MSTQTLKKLILNNQTIWYGRIEKINGQKLTYRPRFYIRPLQSTDVKEMSILSEQIYQKLKKEEKCFIHKHNQDYYTRALNNPNTHFIGVFIGTKLIGMSALSVCSNIETLTNEIPGIPYHLLHRYNNTLSGAFGGDCVLSEFRGNGINQAMIAYRMELAQRLNCQQTFSIIDRNNHWNMTPYFNNGFKMFASAIDPSDGGQISLMRYHFGNQPQIINKGFTLSYTQFDEIDYVLSQGFVGKTYNTQNQTILFVKEIETKHIIRQNILRNTRNQLGNTYFTQNKGMTYV